MNNQKILEGYDTPDLSTNCHSFKIIDGQMFAYNSGGYLLPLHEAQELREALDKYLNGISWSETQDYNAWLLNERINDTTRLVTAVRNKVNPTYIYVVKNARNGYHKIGRSKNPKVRENTLQSEDPELELVIYWQGSTRDETDLHEKFKDKRIRGEWFNLTQDDLEYLYEIGQKANRQETK